MNHASVRRAATALYDCENVRRRKKHFALISARFVIMFRLLFQLRANRPLASSEVRRGPFKAETRVRFLPNVPWMIRQVPRVFVCSRPRRADARDVENALVPLLQPVCAMT